MITTVHVYPPIPLRNFDWQAYDANTMDICGDPDCHCRRNCVIGFGATEAEAIQDYLDQIEERGII
jgi:hypothetical protein